MATQDRSSEGGGRSAVVLCDLEGLSAKDAASRLGIPVATVKTHVARGRKLLAGRLTRRGITVSVGALVASFAKLSDAGSDVTPELIDQTTSNAMRFAAGHAPDEIEVSISVAQATQEVLRAMTLTKFAMIVMAALVAVLAAGWTGGVPGVLSSVATAETIFLDNFDDGDPSDGVPVTWKPAPFFDIGGYEVEGSDYTLTHLSGAISARVAYADISPLGDTSIRAQIRQLQGSGPIALIARVDPVALTAYQAGISSSDGVVYIARNQGPSLPPILAQEPTTLSPSLQDVMLQFDVIGNELTLYAWAAGDEKPTEPILSVSDDTYTSGVPGLLIDGAALHSVAFRFVEVAIPEPSTAVLASVFILIMLTGQWRRLR